MYLDSRVGKDISQPSGDGLNINDWILHLEAFEQYGSLVTARGGYPIDPARSGARIHEVVVNDGKPAEPSTCKLPSNHRAERPKAENRGVASCKGHQARHSSLYVCSTSTIGAHQGHLNLVLTMTALM